MKLVFFFVLALMSLNQTFASSAPSYQLPECKAAIEIYGQPATRKEINMNLMDDGSRLGYISVKDLGKISFKVKESHPGSEDHPVGLTIERDGNLLAYSSGDMYSMKIFVLIDIDPWYEATINCKTGYDD